MYGLGSGYYKPNGYGYGYYFLIPDGYGYGYRYGYDFSKTSLGKGTTQPASYPPHCHPKLAPQINNYMPFYFLYKTKNSIHISRMIKFLNIPFSQKSRELE